MAKKIRVWDGSAWQDVSVALPYNAVHSAQASMPSTAVDGQIWLDTDGTLSDTQYIPKTLTSTTGDIIYASSANTPARLGIGTSGQLLGISGGVPSWTNPSSGGMTVLASGSLSSSSINLTSISQDYIDLYLVIRNNNITSAGQVPNMRINNDSSGIYQATRSSDSGYQVNASDTSWLFGPGNYATTGGNNSFAFTFNDYTSSSWKIGSAVNFFTENAGGYGLGLWRYAARTTNPISQINLFMTTGNFSGTYILYGVK